MSTSQPIRDTQDLTALREFYLKDEPNMRNYVLICLGVNSALRISDLLELKWKDVYNFKDENFKKHLITYEKKTGKETWIAINENARNGYYAWKCGTPPAVLMDIYNHSSYEITKRYLGIKQDDKDSVFLNVNL